MIAEMPRAAGAADGSWSTTVAAGPVKLLRDGQPWTEFTCAAGEGGQTSYRLTVKTGGDPRLHVFETLVRQSGLVLGGAKGLRVENVEVVNTLGPAVTGAERAQLIGVGGGAQATK